MSDTTRSGEQATSLGGQIDDICVHFEDAWQAGRRPSLEHYVAAVSANGRTELLRELLKLDLYYRSRAGDRPTPEEYQARIPDDAELVREVFADAGAAADAPRLVATGTMRYVAQRVHSRGGLGEVLVADDVGMGRSVALKRVQNRLADDAESRRRFLAEAAITGQLEHPGVVPVYGLVQDQNGEPCYAMRFIDGETFQDAARRFHGVASGGRQPPESTTTQGADAPRSPDFTALAFRNLLQRFVAVCNTIAYAHSRGVLHRDLKPANIILGNYGETLVIDWGLARSSDRDAAARATGAETATSTTPPTLASSDTEAGSEAGTRPGQVLGTPAYMSPEQARGESDQLGPATDIFGLGALLYVLLTGRAPYAGRTVLDLLDRAARAEFAPPKLVSGGVPPALDAVCRKAMAAKPEDRYASALDLAADVDRFLADEPVTAYAEPLAARVRRWLRHHARLATGIGITLLIGSAALGAVAWQRERALETTREQKRRTREALDTMISKEMIHRLGAQHVITTGQREFVQKALGYYKEFAAEAATDREGRKLVADAQNRVSALLYWLGARTEALEAMRSALGAYERLAADYPSNPDYRHDVARTRNDLGSGLSNFGRFSEAEAEHRAALGMQQQLVAEFPEVPDYRRTLAGIRSNLATILGYHRQLAEAEAEFRAAAAIQERLRGEFPDALEYDSDLAGTKMNLGLTLAQQSKLAAAEDAFRSAVELQQPLVAKFPDRVNYRSGLAKSQHLLGQVLADQGKRGAALAAYRAALTARETLRDEFPGLPSYGIEAANTLTVLGNLLRADGDAAAALDLHAKAIDRLVPLVAAGPAQVAGSEELREAYWGRANDLVALKRYGDAVPDCERAAKYAEGGDRINIGLFRTLCLARLGRAAEAVAVADELLGEPQANHPELLYGGACVYALAAGTGSSDVVATKAVATLRRAVAAGYANVPHLLADADLASLRRRDDYAALLWDLADGVGPAP